jgi:thiamine-phosphate pyrophosphorylase
MPFLGNSDSLLAYAISDRKSLRGENIISFVDKAVAAGVDIIQIREKDLSDRKLFELVEACSKITRESRTLLLVNDRLDIALACGANGVHLGSHSAPVAMVRNHAPGNFTIGFSAHSMDELRTAEEGGADFVTFSPIYHTASKTKYGPPVGIQALAKACASTSLAVFALGGVNTGNLPEVMSIPVAGIAGISYFQKAENLQEAIEVIHTSKIKWE